MAVGRGSRDPGRNVRRGAEHGELLALAVLGNAAQEAIADAGPQNFRGKVVIDAMNPLDFSAGFPPKLSISEDPLGERVQRALPNASQAHGRRCAG